MPYQNKFEVNICTS